MNDDADNNSILFKGNIWSNLPAWQIFVYLHKAIYIMNCTLQVNNTCPVNALTLHRIGLSILSFEIITCMLKGRRYPIIKKSTTAKSTTNIFCRILCCFILTNVQIISIFPVVPTMYIIIQKTNVVILVARLYSASIPVSLVLSVTILVSLVETVKLTKLNIYLRNWETCVLITNNYDNLCMVLTIQIENIHLVSWNLRLFIFDHTCKMFVHFRSHVQLT
jgi:hypothetical protein